MFDSRSIFDQKRIVSLSLASPPHRIVVRSGNGRRGISLRIAGGRNAWLIRCVFRNANSASASVRTASGAMTKWPPCVRGLNISNTLASKLTDDALPPSET